MNGSRRGLSAVLTFLAVVGLAVFMVLVIKTYDTSDDVESVRAAGPSGLTGAEPRPQASPPPAPAVAPPVGGVATGGGGTAQAGDSFAVPVIGALVSFALLATARTVWQPRRA